MGDFEDITSYVFRWQRTSLDTDPLCISLDGRTIVGQDLFDPILYDPVTGKPIWDLDRDIEVTHPNGKCILTVETTINWDRWKALQELHEAIRLFKVLPGVA